MPWDRTKGRPEPIRALNRVKELENGEPLVLITESCPSVRVARPTVIPYLRKTVAEMLEQAAASLPEGIHMGVVDAWRPFDRQVKIYKWMWRSLEKARPDLPFAAKRRIINRFVAPVDQPAPPGHTTGAAVDVWLFDSDQNEIDVTSPFERLAGAPTYVFGLSAEAQRNRMILVDAMLGAGFSNCRDEWWHYSFGDAGWAVRMDLNECQYGRIDLDPAIYADNESQWNEKLLSRINPFLQEGAPAAKRSKPTQSAD